MADFFMHAKSVTPSDATVTRFKALYVGSTGNVAIRTLDGDTVVFNSVPVGMLRIAGDQVRSTSTTASDIVAFW